MDCPTCRRAIVNRSRKRCEFCNAELPQEVKFSDKQTKSIDELNKAEKKKFKNWNEDIGNKDFSHGDGGVF